MYQQTITSGSSSAVFSQFNSLPQPTAHITLNRGRLKHYGKNVYLKDGSHFEIELHNPKTTSVLAKIWINGKLLSDAGLIVKPGQRVYLERFLNVSNKFKFETYEIEATKENKKAIADNGKIEVWFYDEISYSHGTSSNWQNPWFGTTPQPVYGGNLTVTMASPVYSSNTAYFSNSVGVSGSMGPSGPSGPAGIQIDETGRIEVGESSNQQLESAFGNFNSWTCARVDLQILPESKLPSPVTDLRSYCTGCGTRHKKSSWKFCPNCGTPVNS
jgi:hypothetical protein